MNLKTRLGSFKLSHESSFFISHLVEKNGNTLKLFYEKFFLSSNLDFEIYKHLFRNFGLETFFWHELKAMVGINSGKNKNKINDIIITSQQLDILKENKIIKKADTFNNLIIFFKNLDEEFKTEDYMPGLKKVGIKFEEPFEYSFFVNKKIDEIDIENGLLKFFIKDNLVSMSLKEKLYSSCLASKYRNFMIVDGDQVFCVFEKAAKDPLDMKRLHDSVNVIFPKKYNDLKTSEKDAVLSTLKFNPELLKKLDELAKKEFPKLFRYLKPDQKEIVLSECKNKNDYPEKNRLAEKMFPMTYNDLPGNEKDILLFNLKLKPDEFELDKLAAKNFPRKYDELNEAERDELFFKLNFKPKELKFGDLELDSCIFSVGTKKPYPFIRNRSQLFMVFIPAEIINSKVFLKDFDEKMIISEIFLACETFVIFVDFLHENQKEMNYLKNDFGLLGKIRDNLELVDNGSDFKMKLDFFSKTKSFPFSELFAPKNKEKLINYFETFLKKSDFKELFESAVLQLIKENSTVSFDWLFLNSLIDFSKKINNELFEKNPLAAIAYDSISNNIFKSNFDEALKKNPVISLGVSDFLLKNPSAFSVPNELASAVNSLYVKAAFPPAVNEKFENEKKQAKKSIDASLELSGI
ncbi:MAG: hypothetical protein WC376_05110 [Candidatus Nanoarchaeia archaeon]|jgi:hypothetical protein